MALHFHKLTVKDIHKETEECISICFGIPPEVEKEFSFKQGQNITVKKTIGGEEIRRSYSICSSPFDHELRVAVKKADNGAFSTFANEQFKSGLFCEIFSPNCLFFSQLKNLKKKRVFFFFCGQ